MKEKLQAWRARLRGVQPRTWPARPGGEHLLPAAVLIVLLALAVGMHLAGRSAGEGGPATAPAAGEAATASTATSQSTRPTGSVTPVPADRLPAPSGQPHGTARPLPSDDRKVQAFQSRIAALRVELSSALTTASRLSAGFEQSGAMIPRKVVLEYTVLIGRIDGLRSEIQRLETRRDEYVAKAGGG